MATHVLTDAALWAHDVAVHDLANTLSIDTSREEVEDTVFGGNARKFKVGLFAASVSASGFADMTNYDADLYDVYNTTPSGSPLSVAATADDGDVAYTFRGLTTSLQPLGGNVGDMSALSIEATGRGGVRPVRGRILHPETARTGTGTGTGRQLGAVSSSQSLFAALHVVSASGTTPTLDVVVQSDDNSGFTSATSQITFTQATDKTAEWKSAAGAITDDWFRVSYTIGGTSPSFTFVVVVGIAAN